MHAPTARVAHPSRPSTIGGGGVLTTATEPAAAAAAEPAAAAAGPAAAAEPAAAATAQSATEDSLRRERPMQCLGARIALAPSGLRRAKPVRQARPLSGVASSASQSDASDVNALRAWRERCPDKTDALDVNALRAWREQCPELRAIWDESQPVRAWQGITFGEEGGRGGRVVKIQIRDSDLTGDVPAA